MTGDLIGELNDLARKFADEQSAGQFTGKLTRARGRVLAVQWALFNRNRRDCWGSRAVLLPIRRQTSNLEA